MACVVQQHSCNCCEAHGSQCHFFYVRKPIDSKICKGPEQCILTALYSKPDAIRSSCERYVFFGKYSIYLCIIYQRFKGHPITAGIVYDSKGEIVHDTAIEGDTCECNQHPVILYNYLDATTQEKKYIETAAHKLLKKCCDMQKKCVDLTTNELKAKTIGCPCNLECWDIPELTTLLKRKGKCSWPECKDNIDTSKHHAAKIARFECKCIVPIPHHHEIELLFCNRKCERLYKTSKYNFEASDTFKNCVLIDTKQSNLNTITTKITCSMCQKEEPDDSKFLKCGRCKVASYCSKECQKRDWKIGHKDICSGNLKAASKTETLKTKSPKIEDKVD